MAENANSQLRSNDGKKTTITSILGISSFQNNKFHLFQFFEEVHSDLQIKTFRVFPPTTLFKHVTGINVYTQEYKSLQKGKSHYQAATKQQG